MVGIAALTIVATALLATMLAQIRPLRHRRALLDTLAIVPEWRFYALASIGGAIDFARDVHLVVRDRTGDDAVGGWRSVAWHDDRRARHALWNPGKRSDGMILSIAEDLARASARDPGNVLVQQSLRYLVLLQRCLDLPTDRMMTSERQFAVVYSIGRKDRDVSIAFLSAWHRP